MHRPDQGHPERREFADIARRVSDAMGSSWAFGAACAFVLLWALSGGFFDFSDAWQLVINTGTTIATFLMVFLLQNTQNRDARALHLKLDELIRSTKAARNRLIDLEDCTEQELDDLQREFESVRRRSPRGHGDPSSG
jgi:low affinity Fe/Cu permease